MLFFFSKLQGSFRQNSILGVNTNNVRGKLIFVVHMGSDKMVYVPSVGVIVRRLIIKQDMHFLMNLRIAICI